MQVNQQRLQTDLLANATFGELENADGYGRTTLTGTEANKQARDRLIDQMSTLGLEISIDPIGNIEGRWIPDGVTPTTEPIVAGSHLDSVRHGGIFDGPLGVYGALEAVRTIQEADKEVGRPLSVVSFTGEEGVRFKNGLLGSSVVSDSRSLEQSLAFKDDQGTTVKEALESIDYRGDDEINVANWNAWLELHIEQGTILEENDHGIGIVDGITGITNCRVTISGEANHAGATPMPERQDALVAASQFILDLEQAANEIVKKRSATAVGTVGEIHATPNTKNVVNGEVEIIIDVRDTDYESMNLIVDAAQSSLQELEEQRGVDTEIDRYRDQRPSQISQRCINTATQAAADNDISYQIMSSSAMHDTANIIDHSESVLLFAPSADGISHNPQEWTDWSDCADATQVLANTMYSLASQD